MRIHVKKRKKRQYFISVWVQICKIRYITIKLDSILIYRASEEPLCNQLGRVKSMWLPDHQLVALVVEGGTACHPSPYGVMACISQVVPGGPEQVHIGVSCSQALSPEKDGVSSRARPTAAPLDPPSGQCGCRCTENGMVMGTN